MSREERRAGELGRNFAEVMATQSDPLVDHRDWLWPAVWRVLAEGSPASARQIADLSGRPVADVETVIDDSRQAEVDRDGRVLGIGLTLLPTPHRLQLADRDHALYVWCVPDAFAVASVLGKQLRLTTRCHSTGRHLALDLAPGRIRAIDPPEAVVSFVTSPNLSDLRGTICRHQNLFADAQAAQPWLDDHPDGAVVPVAEAFDVMAPVLPPAASAEPRPEGEET